MKLRYQFFIFNLLTVAPLFATETFFPIAISEKQNAFVLLGTYFLIAGIFGCLSFINAFIFRALGAKQTLFISSVLLFLDFVLKYYAIDNMVVFYISAAVTGVAMTFFFNSQKIWVYQYNSIKAREKMVVVEQLSAKLAAGIGVISIAFVYYISPSFVWIYLLLIFIVSIIFASQITVTDVILNSKKKYKTDNFFKYKFLFIWIIITSFLQGIYFSAIQPFVPILLKSMTHNIPFILLFIGVRAILASMVSKYIFSIRKYLKDILTYIVALIFMGCVYSIFMLGVEFKVLFLGILSLIVLTFVNQILAVLFSTIEINIYPDNIAMQCFSIFASTASLGDLMGSFLFGTFYQYFSIYTTISVSWLIILADILIMYFGYQKLKKV